MNVYIPPPYKDDVLKKVFENMTGRRDVTRLASQIQEMGLIDVWRPLSFDSVPGNRGTPCTSTMES